MNLSFSWLENEYYYVLVGVCVVILLCIDSIDWVVGTAVFCYSDTLVRDAFFLTTFGFPKV